MEPSNFPTTDTCCQRKHSIVTDKSCQQKKGPRNRFQLYADVDAAENYRPVSNLSVLSKTEERAVTQQLESYVVVARLLPRHQSAYRNSHSTEMALLKVCSDLTDMTYSVQ